MDKFQLEIPVAFVIFNRLDTVQRVFEKIKEAQPPRLYIISDGPRLDIKGEDKLVHDTRKWVEDNIDWNCEIHKNYAKENMGCRDRCSSGFSWVFEHEEAAILLEDDCLPNPTFFQFCQESLVHYMDDERVMMVSGTNFFQDKFKMEYDFVFSYFSSVWGWATWRRAWNKYDIKLKQWPNMKKEKILKYLFTRNGYQYLEWAFDATYSGWKTWDYQWDFARINNSGLGITPKYNLVSNIGWNRADSTHTSGDSINANLPTKNMEFSISFPDNILWDYKYDLLYQKESFPRSRYRERMRELLKKWLSGKLSVSKLEKVKTVYRKFKK